MAKNWAIAIAEPLNKSHLILIPRYATLADIATLKNHAYNAGFRVVCDGAAARTL